MAEDDTLMNAAIGGVVSIITSFLLGPASPVAGGAVAGYLERGDTRDGAVVGAIAGLIALVPFLLFAGLFAVVGVGPIIGFFPGVPIDMMAGAPGRVTAFGGGVFLVVFLSVLVVGALVIVGAGALGGVVGVYVAAETVR